MLMMVVYPPLSALSVRVYVIVCVLQSLDLVECDLALCVSWL